jgi:hypothetical protein
MEKELRVLMNNSIEGEPTIVQEIAFQLNGRSDLEQETVYNFLSILLPQNVRQAALGLIPFS